MVHRSRYKAKKKRQNVNIFLPIICNICFGCLKNHLIETVHVGTHTAYVLVEK